MAGERGCDVLIRIGDGGSPEAFVTVAGIRARAITQSAGSVDAMTSERAFPAVFPRGNGTLERPPRSIHRTISQLISPPEGPR